MFYVRKPTTLETERFNCVGWKFKDPDLQNFMEMQCEYEMYQAIHRARPALNVKPIYVHGVVPPMIKEEFNVQPVVVNNGNLHQGGVDLEQFIREAVEDGVIAKAELARDIKEAFPFVGNIRTIYRKITTVVETSDGLTIISKMSGKQGRPPKMIMKT